MTNYNALYPLKTLYNALYIKALSKGEFLQTSLTLNKKKRTKTTAVKFQKACMSITKMYKRGPYEWVIYLNSSDSFDIKLLFTDNIQPGVSDSNSKSESVDSKNKSFSLVL